MQEGLPEGEAERVVRSGTALLRKGKEGPETAALRRAVAPLGISPYTLIHYAPLVSQSAHLCAPTPHGSSIPSTGGGVVLSRGKEVLSRGSGTRPKRARGARSAPNPTRPTFPVS